MKRLGLLAINLGIILMLANVAVADGQATRRTPPTRPPSTGQTTPRPSPRAGAPPRTPGHVVVRPDYRYRPYAYDAYRLGLYLGLPFSGPWYDPYWFEYRPPYPPTYYGWGDQFGAYGAVRLAIPQKEAAVFADGYYLGIVDEFDDALTPLVLPIGPHHIEVKATGYETLTFDVYVRPNRTTTYRGVLQPVGPAMPGPTM